MCLLATSWSLQPVYQVRETLHTSTLCPSLTFFPPWISCPYLSNLSSRSINPYRPFDSILHECTWLSHLIPSCTGLPFLLYPPFSTHSISSEHPSLTHSLFLDPSFVLIYSMRSVILSQSLHYSLHLLPRC